MRLIHRSFKRTLKGTCQITSQLGISLVTSDYGAEYFQLAVPGKRLLSVNGTANLPNPADSSINIALFQKPTADLSIALNAQRGKIPIFASLYFTIDKVAKGDILRLTRDSPSLSNPYDNLELYMQINDEWNLRIKANGILAGLSYGAYLVSPNLGYE